MLKNLKLRSKLLCAFGICALISVVVACLGYSGATHLYGLLQGTVSNNLISIQKTDAIKANAIATNRDLYKALTLALRQTNSEELKAAIRSFGDNQAEADAYFKVYRTTPLEDDERIAGDNFEKDWRAYTKAANEVFELIDRGEAEKASVFVDSNVFPAYRAAITQIKVMIDSNARQAIEVDQAGQQTSKKVFWGLIIGGLLAAVSAVTLGLIVTKMIVEPLRASLQSAARIADGDLTQEIYSESKDETGDLLRAISDMQDGLKSTVQQIARASDHLTSAAEELTAVTDESTRSLIRQNDEIQQAATAVNEMTVAVEEVARNAASTSEISSRTAQDAAQGQCQVQDAVRAVNLMTNEIEDSAQQVKALAEQVRAINLVLDVIRGIAEQTNLLALNAAIEAARAGEQGRGFAVVADEVRALAYRTQASTGEIESMIQSVHMGADEAMQSMQRSQASAQKTQSLAIQAGQALERISSGVEQINERNLVIASAAEQQAQVSREVDRNLMNIQGLSAQTSAGASQTCASSQELERLAISFNTTVGKFKL